MAGSGAAGISKHKLKNQVKKHLEVKEDCIGAKKRLHEGGSEGMHEVKRRKMEENTPKEKEKVIDDVKNKQS
jgi:hypothetical protein